LVAREMLENTQSKARGWLVVPVTLLHY
jgi:hypothetical protein